MDEESCFDKCLEQPQISVFQVLPKDVCEIIHALRGHQLSSIDKCNIYDRKMHLHFQAKSELVHDDVLAREI